MLVSGRVYIDKSVCLENTPKPLMVFDRFEKNLKGYTTSKYIIYTEDKYVPGSINS